MDVGVLSSGGKDSALAACLLEPVCEVTMCCCSFGVTDDYEHAMAAAEAIGLPARRVDLDPQIGRQAAELIVEDGFPRNGIQQVHEHALETAAQLPVDAIADGTRRDDRTPRVDRPLAQRIEDRHDTLHIAPLAGYGRAAIDRLVEATLVVESGPSAEIPKGDYEAELRAMIAETYDQQRVEDLFPAHTQSRVTGRLENTQ